MATSNHIVGHSNTTQSIDDGSTPSNSERVYETGAFSTNVTPPLNFKHVSHILNISTGPTASTSSSSAPTRHPLFGGASRATDFTEVSYNVALASSSQNGESLSLYNGKRPGESTTTARRLSFTALKALEGHGQGFEMHGHRSHAYKEAGGAVKGGREDQATLPVIPDELMAVLALPPGSSINANAFTKQDALVSDRSLRIESNEGSMRKTSTLPSTSRNIPRAPNVPSIAPSLNNMLSPGSLAPRLTGSSSNTSVHQRRSLRKAASAESLQTAASVRNGVNTSTDVDSMLANMRGLGIIATNSTVTASFLPSFNDAGNTSTDGTGSSSSSARDLTSASRHPTTGQLPSRTTDVKSIWKSFSSKLPGRSLTTTGTSSSGNNVNNGKEKERDMSSTFTQFLKNDTGNSNLSAHYPDGKVLRKSFESTVRHSLSIYPRSRIDKDNLQLRTTRTEDDRCINNRPSEDKTASNIVAGATSQVSLSKSEVDSVSGESHWMSREQFTHDLSQRSKKHHKPITSSHGPAAAGRNSRNILNPPANGVVDDEQEELDDEDEDENEEDDQASQLSFIDPIHLGPSTSLPSLGEHDENEVNENMQAQESRLHDSGGRHHVPQPQPRRNTSPDNMPKSMAASLQRNRADSTVILPPRISTDLPPSITLNEVTKTNDTTTASNLDSSPPRLTPDTASTVYMDAFSSPLLSGPLSPARNGSSFSYFPNTSPPSDNAVQSKQDSENSNISAIRPIVSGPPSPVYTVRPRSMSESFLPVSASSAAQGGNGGGIMEVRAPQPNKSNILNVSLADRRIVQTEEDQPLMRLNEKQQGEVGQLSDVPPALTGVSVGICRDGNGESSGNTTTSSSFDLSRSSPVSLLSSPLPSSVSPFRGFERPRQYSTLV